MESSGKEVASGVAVAVVLVVVASVAPGKLEISDELIQFMAV